MSIGIATSNHREDTAELGGFADLQFDANWHVGTFASITIIPIFINQEVDDDEALWDELFAQSQDLIDRLADEALAEHQAGLTEEFDPDNDSDML